MNYLSSIFNYSKKKEIIEPFDRTMDGLEYPFDRTMDGLEYYSDGKEKKEVQEVQEKLDMTRFVSIDITKMSKTQIVEQLKKSNYSNAVERINEAFVCMFNDKKRYSMIFKNNVWINRPKNENQSKFDNVLESKIEEDNIIQYEDGEYLGTHLYIPGISYEEICNILNDKVDIIHKMTPHKYLNGTGVGFLIKID